MKISFIAVLAFAGCTQDAGSLGFVDPWVASRGIEVARERQIAGWIDRLPSPDAHELLVKAGPEAETPLIYAVAYGTPDRATAALSVLEARRMPELARLLVEVWHKRPMIGSRAAVADAWGRLGDPSVVAEVAHFLDTEPVLQVRARLARALGIIRDVRALDALGRAALDPSPILSIEAVNSLGALGSPAAIGPLLDALESSGTDVTLAVAAIEGLGRLRARSSLDALMRRLAESADSSIREACAIALGRIGDPRAVSALIDALGDRSWSVFQACDASLRSVTGISPDLPAGDDLQRRTQEAWRKWKAQN